MSCITITLTPLTNTYILFVWLFITFSHLRIHIRAKIIRIYPSIQRKGKRTRKCTNILAFRRKKKNNKIVEYIVNSTWTVRTSKENCTQLQLPQQHRSRHTNFTNFNCYSNCNLSEANRATCTLYNLYKVTLDIHHWD